MAPRVHRRSEPRGQIKVSFGIVAIVTAVAVTAGAASPTVERLGLKIISTFPHDPTAFTQGLLLNGGRLYESTGIYGSSTVRRVDPGNGEVQQSVAVNSAYFAEGLALVPDSAPGTSGDRLIQLTWRAGIALVYELESLNTIGTFSYTGEGWGLCYDAGRQRLVMSDGSSRLTLRNPITFAKTGTLKVTLEGSARDRLNELECVGDVIYANVWQSNSIVRIDANTGVVNGVIDASNLLSRSEAAGAEVLNGIAHDPAHGTLLLTGKQWPKLFEVELVPASAKPEPSGTAGRCRANAPGVFVAPMILAIVLLRRPRLRAVVSRS